MKKRYYTFFFCLLFSAEAANAQHFSLSPGATDSVFAPLNETSVFDILPHNLLPGSILFKWERITVDMPVGWDFQFCDNANCYTSMPAQGEMDPVDAGGDGLLSLHLTPYNVSGQGILSLYLYDDGFYSDGDTVTWIITAGPVGIEDISAFLFSLSPNPVSDKLSLRCNSLTGAADIKIYNLAGEVVTGIQSFKAMQETTLQVDVSTLSCGIYFLKITDERNSGVQKFVIN
jgi:hypothetical protein